MDFLSSAKSSADAYFCFLLLFDDDVPRCQNIAIPVALYRFSSIFLDRLVFGDCLFIVDVPSSVEISYFMVILFYFIVPAGD